MLAGLYHCVVVVFCFFLFFLTKPEEVWSQCNTSTGLKMRDLGRVSLSVYPIPAKLEALPFTCYYCDTIGGFAIHMLLL